MHGSPLGHDEVTATKKNLGWPLEPKFYIPEEALAQFRKAIDIGARLESEWKEKFNSYRKTYPVFASEWDNMMNFKFPDTWDKDIPVFPPDPKGLATRSASGKVMNEIAIHIPSLIGGSADLNPSTNTELKGKAISSFLIQRIKMFRVQHQVNGDTEAQTSLMACGNMQWVQYQTEWRFMEA